MTLFFGSLLVLVFGAVGSLLSHTHSRFVSGITAAFASIGMMLFAGSVLAAGGVQNITLPTFFPLFELSFHVDMLSALFIFLIALITLPVSLFGISYLKHYKLYDLHVFGFFYNLFLITLFLIVTSYNGLSFLFFWEIMSLTSVYFVLFEHKRIGAVGAGVVYFIMTHVAAFCLLIAFLLLYQHSGSFDFGVIKTYAPHLSLWMYSIIFGLFLVGFGTKAGIIPFHIWLPKAHSSAPAHTSALMSGIMIKMGIFMFFRMFLDILPPSTVIFGSIILVIGAFSSLLGVLYALAEHDIKRLLAYHSIENIGIILLGLGGGMVLFSLGQYPLAALAIVAGLFHTINHAVFKSLLFLGAGAVMHQVHTRDMERFGGLIKKMPLTALFFLIGSIAIVGLPPLNGFVSEWLTLQSLIQGIILTSGSFAPAVFLFSITALVFTAGLAGACFVKAFAGTFLARPRSHEAEHAKEVGPLFIGSMGTLALLCFLLSIFSGSVVVILTRVVQSLSSGKDATFALTTMPGTLTTGNGFGSMNMPFVIAGIALLVGLGWIGVYIIARKRKEIRRMIWDCGYTQLTPRMEITTTGFARTLILIFKGIFQPTKQDKIEYVDVKSRYQPLSRTIMLGVTNHYEKHVYYPLHNSFLALSHQMKKIQGGSISQYLLYIFLTLIGLLIWVRY